MVLVFQRALSVVSRAADFLINFIGLEIFFNIHCFGIIPFDIYSENHLEKQGSSSVIHIIFHNTKGITRRNLTNSPHSSFKFAHFFDASFFNFFREKFVLDIILKFIYHIIIIPKNFMKRERKMVHSFLLIGQSNAAGRGFPEEAEPLDNLRGRLKVQRNGLWVPMFRPVNPDRHTSDVCFAESFAKEYALAHPDIEVGIIPCADGGTRISQVVAYGFSKEK